MEALTKSLVFSLLLTSLLYLGGIIIYHKIEGWNWIDSVYFMTATITTVGYGDIIPVTDEGKLFTTIFMWAGISIGFYLLYNISRYRERTIDLAVLKVMKKLGKTTSSFLPDEIKEEDAKYLGVGLFGKGSAKKSKQKKKKYNIKKR